MSIGNRSLHSPPSQLGDQDHFLGLRRANSPSSVEEGWSALLLELKTAELDEELKHRFGVPTEDGVSAMGVIGDCVS